LILGSASPFCLLGPALFQQGEARQGLEPILSEVKDHPALLFVILFEQVHLSDGTLGVEGEVKSFDLARIETCRDFPFPNGQGDGCLGGLLLGFVGSQDPPITILSFFQGAYDHIFRLYLQK
jgi:hypothetical protein